MGEGVGKHDALVFLRLNIASSFSPITLELTTHHEEMTDIFFTNKNSSLCEYVQLAKHGQLQTQ